MHLQHTFIPGCHGGVLDSRLIPQMAGKVRAGQHRALVLEQCAEQFELGPGEVHGFSVHVYRAGAVHQGKTPVLKVPSGPRG